jgi:hypothetical protein
MDSPAIDGSERESIESFSNFSRLVTNKYDTK